MSPYRTPAPSPPRPVRFSTLRQAAVVAGLATLGIGFGVGYLVAPRQVTEVVEEDPLAPEARCLRVCGDRLVTRMVMDGHWDVTCVCGEAP